MPHKHPQKSPLSLPIVDFYLLGHFHKMANKPFPFWHRTRGDPSRSQDLENKANVFAPWGREKSFQRRGELVQK